MKSFSASGVAAEQSDAFELAVAAVNKNPQALFTDFQWFLYRAQNTVYFTAFSAQPLDKDGLMSLVANMASLAPQLTHGFVGALPGQPLSTHMLDALTTLVEVDEFDASPDPWLEPGLDVFENPDLPLFRVCALVRKGGADDQGRASMIMIRSSHALMEGSDSALLTRSRHSGHGAVASAGTTKLPLKQRLTYGLIAALTVPIHLVSGLLLSPAKMDMGFRTLTLERKQVRRIANKLGVSQRAVMFGTVMHILNRQGAGFSPRKIKTTYTTLDSDRQDADDDFFRVRAIDAQFDVADDLPTFLRGVHQRIAEVESKDTAHMQFIYNAMFKTHRFLARLLPFIYTQRFFRFNGGIDMVLTLVPPHRLYGNLTYGMMEPIYCGSYHPGSNLCTFVPARQYVTFNFTMQHKHLDHVDAIMEALDQLDQD